MVIRKTVKSNSVIATFGVALSSLFVVPDVQADVIEITWNFGQQSIAFGANGSYSAGVGYPAIIDQLGSDVDFCVFYTQFTNGPYGSNYVFGRGFEIENKSITGIAEFQAGDAINPDTFVAQTKGFELDGSSAYAGFRTASGNVGWFKINLATGFSFAEGEFGNRGESMMVGELKGDVNCDGSVNLLDVAPFVELLSSGKYLSKADFDNNDAVDLLDVAPFVDSLAGG